jgi:hypothetical protein
MPFDYVPPADIDVPANLTEALAISSIATVLEVGESYVAVRETRPEWKGTWPAALPEQAYLVHRSDDAEAATFLQRARAARSFDLLREGNEVVGSGIVFIIDQTELDRHPDIIDRQSLWIVLSDVAADPELALSVAAWATEAAEALGATEWELRTASQVFAQAILDGYETDFPVLASSHFYANSDGGYAKVNSEDGVDFPIRGYEATYGVRGDRVIANLSDLPVEELGEGQLPTVSPGPAPDLVITDISCHVGPLYSTDQLHRSTAARFGLEYRPEVFEADQSGNPFNR